MSISEEEVKVSEPARLAATSSSPYRTITDKELTLVQISCDFVCACIALPLALFVLAQVSSVPTNTVARLMTNLQIDSLFPVAVVMALAFGGVYRVSADLGSMTLLFGHFVQPNGLAFSPDESVLYVIDSRRRQIFAFDMLPNGTVAKQSERLFADLGGPEPGSPDGMKVDVAGNIYSGGEMFAPVADHQRVKIGGAIAARGHDYFANLIV